MAQQLMEIPSAKGDLQKLTEREQAVFWSVVKGSRSIDIAKQMLISRHTVDTHRRNIIKKLNFSSASDWFRLAEEV